MLIVNHPYQMAEVFIAPKLSIYCPLRIYATVSSISIKQSSLADCQVCEKRKFQNLFPDSERAFAHALGNFNDAILGEVAARCRRNFFEGHISRLS